MILCIVGNPRSRKEKRDPAVTDRGFPTMDFMNDYAYDFNLYDILNVPKIFNFSERHETMWYI